MNDIGNNANAPVPGTSTWDQTAYPQNNNDPSAMAPSTPTKATPAEPAQNFNTNEDLHPDLILQGWRKCWSKRENRHYYWNKISGESLWDVPPQGGQFDPLADPLGICGGSTPSPHSAAVKRRPSEEQAGPPLKRFVLAGPWDLEVCSNVIIFERQPTLLPHPHPEIEAMRAAITIRLIKTYEDLCMRRENIKAPKDSFMRWLMERKIVDRGFDPLLPSSVQGSEISPTMYREIMNDIPLKIVKPKFTGDARKQLSKFAEAAKNLIENRSAPPESKKVVKWNAEETFQWLRRTVGASYEDFQDRLMHLKRQCQPHLVATVKTSVEQLCTKVYTQAKDNAVKIYDRHMTLLKENGMPMPQPPPPPPSARKVWCYPVQFALPPIRVPVLEYVHERDHMVIKYSHASMPQPDTQYINLTHLQKLEQLYRFNCYDDKKFDLFIARVWCLLRRYQTFLGNLTGSTYENELTQAALPVSVFECLHRNFGVTFECFASPLNSYFRQYCSAFSDTDSYFGSRGPFLEFKPLSGSFQMNPPMCEELIDASLQHIDRLLSDSQEPLSFIVFLPELKEPILPYMSRIDESHFKRKLVIVPGMVHEYRHGYQHVLPNRTDIYMKSVQGTMVVWLQNNAGYTRWGPFDSRVDQLLDAFRPVREKERDRQDFMPVPPGEPTKPATSTSATTTDSSTTTTTTTTTATSEAVVVVVVSDAVPGSSSNSDAASPDGAVHVETHSDPSMAPPTSPAGPVEP